MDTSSGRRQISLRAIMDFSHLEPSVQKHLRNVYTTLSVCTLSASAGGWVYLNTSYLHNTLMVALLALVAMITLGCMQHSPKNLPTRFGLLCAFATLVGASIGPLLNLATRVSPQLVPSAFLLTVVIFVALTLSAMLSKRREFIMLGSVLFSALFYLVLLRFVNVFARSEALFDLQLYCGLLVFCGFVLFDTQLIVEKRRCGDDDFIWHAVELFIDTVDIFIRILVILVKKEN